MRYGKQGKQSTIMDCQEILKLNENNNNKQYQQYDILSTKNATNMFS